MHHLLGFIVYADDGGEARNFANGHLDCLCLEGGPFDYGSLLSSPNARWREMCPHEPVLVESVRGRELIEMLMVSTEKSFQSAIAGIRSLLPEHTDEELMQEVCVSHHPACGLYLFRYDCFRVGRYEGPGISLYDDDGHGIRDRRHLKNVLTHWPDSKAEPDSRPIWIVFADAHS